jgi:hypothetical protein
MQTEPKKRPHTKAKSASSESAQSEEKSGLPSSPSGPIESGSFPSDGPETTKSSSTEAAGLPQTAEEFDRRFDEGESIFDLGVSKTGWTRPGLEVRRFNIDLPVHFIEKLDRAAQIRGITRQSLVKTWLYDRLQEETKR